jgi:hypothetical protein
MASATRPDIRRTHSVKAATKSAPSGDSREKLLKDVMREIGVGLEGMSSPDRLRAIAEIHSIAENVRTRQAE